MHQDVAFCVYVSCTPHDARRRMSDSSDHARIQCEMAEAYSSFALLYKDKALDPSPFIHSEHAQDEYSLYESSMQKGQ